MTGDLAPCHDVPSPDLPYNTDANLLVEKLHQRACLRIATDSIRFDMFNVLGGNWDPTDRKFSSVNQERYL